MSGSILATNYPPRAHFSHLSDKVLTGNAIISTSVGSQYYSGCAIQSPAANADSFFKSFVVRAGTYTLRAVGYATTDAGKIDWYIDNVLVSSAQDWYLVAGTVNTIKSITGIVIASDGYHEIKGVVNGKNAASTGFKIYISSYSLTLAAD